MNTIRTKPRERMKTISTTMLTRTVVKNAVKVFAVGLLVILIVHLGFGGQQEQHLSSEPIIKIIPEKGYKLQILSKEEDNIKPDFFNGMAQDYPGLISYLKSSVILPPSQLPYNLTNPQKQHFSQFGQSQLVDKLLSGMTGGFFVEAGANAGEWLSNTLFFERQRNWTGLLVEPQPYVFRELVNKHRKAFCVEACLSTTPTPMVVKYETKGKMSVLGMINNKAQNAIQIQCYPLFSLLAALGVSRIDYFSLDIETWELPVLQTIPWDKIEVRILDIEVGDTKKRKEAIKNYMESVGYTFIHYHRPDSYFIKEDLFEEQKLKEIKKTFGLK